MKNNLEAIQYAQGYVWNTMVVPLPEALAVFPTMLDVKLNGSLQYRLCQFVDHMNREFGEVTRKEIALLIEAWIAASSPGASREPIQNWGSWYRGKCIN